MWTVILSSKEYGNEAFDYETKEEAVAGVERIRLAAKKLDDGIERWFKILPPEDTDNAET